VPAFRQAYQNVAIKADSAIAGERDSLDALTEEMAKLNQDANAQLPDRYLGIAEKLAERPLNVRHVKPSAKSS
jgi:hypothetical protein